MMATHVDDFLFAHTEESAYIVKQIWDELHLGSEEEAEFRFCGKEFVQSLSTFDIRIFCKATAAKLHFIRLSKERSKQVEDPLLNDEHEEFMSVVGSLMWIGRSCRPGIAYRVSELQTALKKPVIEDVMKCNRVVKYIKEEQPDECLTFLSGAIRWPSVPGAPIEICVASVSDASHGSEDEYLPLEDVREPFRSQGAKLNFLAGEEMLTTEAAGLHVISFGSNIVRRVCNSTIKAETYQLQLVVENGDLVRASIADAHGLLDRTDWEASAASFCLQVWFTDCMSCHQTLQKPIQSKGMDKRLGIELAALRQCLWRSAGEGRADPRLYDALPMNPTDICRWIDTLVMIADPLTKAMKCDELMRVLNTNYWCWAQPENAKQIKQKKQAQRRVAKDKKQAADEPKVDSDHDRDPRQDEETKDLDRDPRQALVAYEASSGASTQCSAGSSRSPALPPIQSIQGRRFGSLM